MSQHPSDRLPSLPATPRLTEKEGQTQQRVRRQLPRYKLILLNNTACDMMFVVRTIMELTRLCRAEATHKMWEAHHSGRSLLLVTYRERAELYVEQFADKGLEVMIEPAG
jgi:ATP-dependent Clp protease adaptor protein ClpS